jgi:hypothetical protein
MGERARDSRGGMLSGSVDGDGMIEVELEKDVGASGVGLAELTWRRVGSTGSGQQGLMVVVAERTSLWVVKGLVKWVWDVVEDQDRWLCGMIAG